MSEYNKPDLGDNDLLIDSISKQPMKTILNLKIMKIILENYEKYPIKIDYISIIPDSEKIQFLENNDLQIDPKIFDILEFISKNIESYLYNSSLKIKSQFIYLLFYNGFSKELRELMEKDLHISDYQKKIIKAFNENNLLIKIPKALIVNFYQNTFV